MPATKTKTKTETTETSDMTDLNELIDLSTSFTKEIQNIMTSHNLNEATRASALGTATKYFADAVDVISKKHA